MADVIDKAVTDRERPLRDDVVVPFRTGYLRLRADDTQRIVRAAQRRFRRHNAARRWVESEVWSAMAATWREATLSAAEVNDAVRSLPEVREALERMWPVLTPAQLLHDLFGSKALLKLAAGTASVRSTSTCRCIARVLDDVAEVRWTDNDVALLDEARNYLGARPTRNPAQNGQDADEIRTYGHIVIDEVQDLTPMQLRMVVAPLAERQHDRRRRHRPGHRGARAERLGRRVAVPARRNEPSRVIGLSVGYRIPAQIMELANQVMLAATPTLRAPTSVRHGDDGSRVHPVVRRRAVGQRRRGDADARSTEISDGTIAVVAPDSMVDRVSQAPRGRRHRARPGHSHGSRTGRHRRAGQRRQGPRARRCRRGRAGDDRRRRAAGSARALRGADPQHAAPHRRARRRPARSLMDLSRYGLHQRT